MDLICKPPVKDAKNVYLRITGSKSETNRLLILKALYPNLTIENGSDSDDSRYLAKVLESKDATLDIGHAGTAMRFGTAYFATQEGIEITLTGSDRMKERPIGILVDALNSLGASVHYEGETGFPPLRIIGKKITGGDLAIDASVSSQFLTALLLVAPSFEKGLVLRLKGVLTSRPYLEMTVNMLEQLGVTTSWEVDKHTTTEIITVRPCESLQVRSATVESDWSSAGYWYSWTALQQPGFEMELSHYYEKSLQGDSKLAVIFKDLGVQTQFLDGCIKLKKINMDMPAAMELDLTQEPDQAQTIFATCLGLGIDVHLTGLHTLKIKETDRIEA
ncbi:MAG: 3-phosphoshikimate 1-carboxyvinyltransferase, partial [Nonlabens sp.]|nr:3-phosphoshikimate 1-carboxyvinyltransferase [Nonlabens sp.]